MVWPQQSPAQTFPVQVPDALGGRVTLPAAPRRVVSLAPSVTETLFALGLDPEIVGIGDADDYPPEKVRGRARVGGVIINLERVIALRPDLVVGMPSLQRAQLLRLKALGLRVLAVDAGSVAESIGQIRLLGLATGRVAEAETLARGIERRVRSVRPSPRRRVYVELWNEPLLAVGGGTLVNDLITRGGGRNILAERQGYVSVPLETVLMRGPQVVFLLYAGRARFLARPEWRGTEAWRSSRVYELPPSLVTRPGPRIGEGLALTARLLRGER
jgi:iron complex transport system substrate-binding protein